MNRKYSSHDDDLEEESAATGTSVSCPYCGESVEIALDPSGGTVQEYVEDCQVCCQPWCVQVQYTRNGSANVAVTALDE
jgi:hypothetical protein